MPQAAETKPDQNTSKVDAQSTPEPQDLAAPAESVLLSADRPVAPAKLAAAIGLLEDEKAPFPDQAKADLAAVITGLNEAYEQTGRSFRIETVAGGYRMMTLPEFARFVACYQQQKVSNRLSKPAVETLAIVAYRQPVTRAEIESIRGVACGEVLKTLMDHRLVTIQGRAEELGRPILYGTTRQFLDTFGLATLKDLPPAGETGATR